MGRQKRAYKYKKETELLRDGDMIGLWSGSKPETSKCCICGRALPNEADRHYQPRRTGPSFTEQWWVYCGECVPPSPEPMARFGRRVG